ncbi:DUF5615 family PIN-like protein [Hymenobacter sp. 102]|uniref:DUF5615 family PIN-like protein n=1 Tax=Hymenobacter sp. 102 TaxID=3403152 RepID=UPI003CEE2572
MRLLLDENISWRVAAYLRPHFAEVLHVRDVDLDNSPDTSIWRYAQQHGFHILTKDEDFIRLLFAHGFPPKIVVVTNAQLPAKMLADFMLARLPQLQEFLGDSTAAGMLVLRLP